MTRFPSVTLAWFGLGAVLVVLGLFVAYTTLQWVALVYALIGAAICIGLGLVLRRKRMRPLFEERPL